MSHEEEIARLRAENAALQNEARQIWAQVPDGYKLSSGARPLEAIRLMVEGLWAMSEEVRALRAENASLDRIATDYYERLTGEVQEEIARLQSGIAALREVLTQRRDDWQDRISREMAYQEPSPYAPYCLGYIDSLTATIKDLNALFPPDASASGNQRRNSDDNSGRK